jgi:predicted AlkP superfamily phosphohydrolase/phosphomutase
MLARIVEAAGEDTLLVVVSDHGAVADGPTFNPYMPLIKAGLCKMEGQGDNTDTKALEERTEQVHQFVRAMIGNRVGPEIMETATLNQFHPDITRSQAFPQRTIYVYVNLKGRDPGGIVEPADYEKVQHQIIDALYTYVDPVTGKRPVSLALTKKDARILGLHGDAVGDVIYAIYPEFGGQHGPHLPTTEWGVGKLRALEAYYGPGIKKGFKLERTCGLTDIVPTICHMMNWPVPAQTEGNVLFQVMQNPDFASEELTKMRNALAKMEETLSKGEKH